MIMIVGVVIAYSIDLLLKSPRRDYNNKQHCHNSIIIITINTLNYSDTIQYYTCTILILYMYINILIWSL